MLYRESFWAPSDLNVQCIFPLKIETHKMQALIIKGHVSFSKCMYLQFQVWFQNRRMKDKRQRLAMTWPHPADPAFYTYMLSHAAASAGGLPYPFPSHLPLPYYPPLGGAASAGGAPLIAGHATARSLDGLRVLSSHHPYPRPELLCAFRHPSLYAGAAHALGPGGSPCSCLACQTSGVPPPPPPPPAPQPRSANADFSRAEGFLTFTPAVLSKPTAVALDQREEVQLTR